jgi:DNA-directed RNA polymerase subunit H (RpoH/RPB5)
LGHMDPSDDQDSGTAESAGTEPLSRAKGQGSAPGSLMSVKIRKRASISRGQPAAAQPEVRAPDPVAASKSEKPGKSRPASDAISRVTRRAQTSQVRRTPASRQTPVYHAPTVRPSIDPPPAPKLSDSPPRDTDIVAYWTRLRASRRFPRSSEIDAATISECWPNSILMRCRPGSRALEPEKVFMSGEAIAPGLSGLRGRGRVNLSPMMLQWLLALAGAVVQESRPMNDVETFPSVKRVVHYRAVALPFSDNEIAVDHVLCHFQSEA